MNYAINDVTEFPTATPPRFGPSRVGGGRVDPAKAVVGNVVAMNADDAGLSYLTFSQSSTLKFRLPVSQRDRSTCSSPALRCTSARSSPVAGVRNNLSLK